MGELNKSFNVIMFKLVNTFHLTENDIFQDIPSDELIVDYIISSYTIDIELVRTFYYRKELQVHCGIAQKAKGDEPWIHVHDLSQYNGIYHVKFILVTTPRIVRFIWTSANFVFPMIRPESFKQSSVEKSICKNDFYFITLPLRVEKSDLMNEFVDIYHETNSCTVQKEKSTKEQEDTLDDIIKLCSENSNEIENPYCNLNIFKRFCTSFNINMIIPIEWYDWSLVPFKFVVSIPNDTTLNSKDPRMSMVPLKSFFRKHMFTKLEVVTSSVINMFNIYSAIPFASRDVVVHVPQNIFTEPKNGTTQSGTKKMETSCFMISIDPKNERYKYKYEIVKNTYRYHVKRYIFSTTTSDYLLLTSANFTSKAWNGNNAELGLLFEIPYGQIHDPKTGVSIESVQFHEALAMYFNTIKSQDSIHPFVENIEYGLTTPIKCTIKKETVERTKMDPLVQSGLTVLRGSQSKDTIEIPMTQWVNSRLETIETESTTEQHKIPIKKK